jgi:hypothetical protein
MSPRPALLASLLVLLLAGCPARNASPPEPTPPPDTATPAEAPGARAALITRDDQRLPGPQATSRLGDLRLENDAVIAVIAAPDHKSGFAASGGNLIDLTLRDAPWDELDQLLLWLDVTWPRQAIYTRVSVVEPGGPGLPAVIEAVGHDSDDPALSITTRYTLPPTGRAVSITTTLTNTTSQPLSHFELGEALQWGDTRTFLPGVGFAFAKGAIQTTWMAGEGRRTSYAWRPVGEPGPFDTLQGSPWSDVTVKTVTLQPGESASWTRRLGVGASVADAAEPLLDDQPRHAASGRVTEAGTGQPIPNATLTAMDASQGLLRPMLRARTTPDGAFSLLLPPGRWTLLIEAPARKATSLDLGDLQAPQRSLAAQLSPTAQARFIVQEAGQPIPARVTLTGRDGTPTPSIPEHPDHLTSRSQLYLLGASPLIPLPPGRYTALASRGPEYTVHALDIEVQPGDSPTFTLDLARVVDTTGWLSGDFHQHAAPSPDSSVPLIQRVRTNLAEGVEILVGTDHNKVTDYRPVIADLGAGPYIAGIVGDEVTCELGHFNTFPLLPQPDAPNGGALDPNGLAPADLFAALRALPPEGKLLQINHPRAGRIGYFDQMKLRAASTTADDPRMSWDFDAVEIINGKRVEDALRTMDDWFALLNAGYDVIGTGNSDTHGTEGEEPGTARTWVRFGHDDPARVDGAALTRAVRTRAVVASNGPFLQARLDDTPIGGRHPLGPKGARATLHVNVQAPPWLPLHRVELIRDGKVIHTWPLDPANRDTLRLAATLPLPADKPAWYLLRAQADTPLGPNTPDPTLVPLAFTNPIWVGAPKP